MCGLCFSPSSLFIYFENALLLLVHWVKEHLHVNSFKHEALAAHIQCLCVSSTIITASIIVIIISHSCTFHIFFFSPLPAHIFFLKSFMHFTRRCNKNCSMRTHTHTINNLQIDDCIIQSASEVHYNVNEMSCLTSIAKKMQQQHQRPCHTSWNCIYFDVVFVMFLPFFFHKFLPCACACVCKLFSQCERS